MSPYQIQEDVDGVGLFPDGNYKGEWSGYTIRFEYGGKHYSFVTDRGIRGQSPVIFKIVQGKVVPSSVNVQSGSSIVEFVN